MEYEFLGKKISGRFTIPSGIVTTNPKILLKIAKEIPEIGVLTTKSIGPEEKKGNREPIIHKYAPGCFVNAVGLTNPGAKEFAKQLSEIKSNIPKDKFLLISIFGSNAQDFVDVAKILEEYADGFELNLSCPHAKGYGMAIGQDPQMVKEIVHAVKQAVKVPVIPKLTPNTNNIGEIAKSAQEGGADGICAINTVGPGYFTFDGIPVLSNKKGGMSGKGVLPIGLKCIKEISESVTIPIIGCGGVSTAQDVIEYTSAGASIIGVGSTLAGMNSIEMKNYFFELEQDIQNKTKNANKLLKEVNMQFEKYIVEKVEALSDDLAVISFDKGIEIGAGQFVFAWIPQFGEKPFSALDNNPLKLLIQKRGCLTEKLLQSKKGDEVYFRGPYGKEIIEGKEKKVVIVGGGCGIAALYQLAKEINSKTTEVFFGARDEKHLFYIDELKKCSTVWITTNDGSVGKKGFVTDALKERLMALTDEEKKNIVFYNCGPEVMINAVLPIEEQYANKENIFCAIDYVTKCGIGICGACASKSGKRICTDGPFLNRMESE